MKFFHTYFERRHSKLAELYGKNSRRPYRAANLCNLSASIICILGILLILGTAMNLASFSPKRTFYMGVMGSMLLAVIACYYLTILGKFGLARFMFMALNVVFLVPAVLLTGGIPDSAAIILLPLPILYAFCLYSGRESISFVAAFFLVLLLMIIVPRGLNLNLPDFANGDIFSKRKILTFLILTIITIFTLISLQFENERAVRRAQDAAKSKSEFLANMSHEIRTPMNGVLGITEVLMGKPMPDDQKELLGVVQTSGTALLTIINDILDFSKLDSGQFELESEPFELKPVLRDIHALMKLNAETKGLNFSIGYARDCPDAFIGDNGRLRQVLLNIVGNAIKFTDSGDIKLTARNDAAGQLQIDVEDTGIGIDPGKVDHLFEQFTQAETSTTRRFGGTGLGLSISQKIIQAMGGDISVTSEPGKGSMFSVHLPLPVARAA